MQCRSSHIQWRNADELLDECGSSHENINTWTRPKLIQLFIHFLNHPFSNYSNQLNFRCQHIADVKFPPNPRVCFILQNCFKMKLFQRRMIGRPWDTKFLKYAICIPLKIMVTRGRVVLQHANLTTPKTIVFRYRFSILKQVWFPLYPNFYSITPPIFCLFCDFNVAVPLLFTNKSYRRKKNWIGLRMTATCT